VSLGTGASGLFACIPDHQAGCWLSGLEDVGYNGEKLSAAKKNVVDEIGFMPVSKTEANLFFSFVSNCYESKSLVLTVVDAP
jgi:hypothetical protein